MGSRDRSWAEAFDRLVTALAERWQGDVWRPTEPGEDRRDAVYFEYPKLRATVNRHNVELEISGLPLSGAAELERADKTEYLRMFVPCPLEHRVLIRHEGFLDRVAKAFRLSWEFQTGNEHFDRKYFLNSEKGQALDWICQPDVQETIESLEPFTALRIFEHGIQWSRQLTGEQDLDLENIAEAGERLVDLSVLLRENPF